MTPQGNHRSYRELCSDPARCPLGAVPSPSFTQGIARLYSYWATTGDSPKTSGELADDVVANLGARMNGGLAVMVENQADASGVLQVLHGITKSAVPNFYRRTFAYVGDVHRGHMETIEFAETLLGITGEERIFTDAQAQLDAFAAGGRCRKHENRQDEAGHVHPAPPHSTCH